MSLRRYPIIAREGWPFILGVLLLLMVASRVGDWMLWASIGFLLLILILLFRDPRRDIPAVPLGVVAPVDGRILSIQPTDKGELKREALLIEMTVDHFGAYMARSPTEGKVLDLRDNIAAGSRMTGVSGLWVRSDEGDDVVVLMVGVRRIAKPRSFVGYGERLGQGERFAFIRLARRARIFLPLDCELQVRPGQKVRAGADLLAQFTRYKEDTEES